MGRNVMKSEGSYLPNNGYAAVTPVGGPFLAGWYYNKQGPVQVRS